MDLNKWLINKGKKSIIFVTGKEANGISGFCKYWTESKPELFYPVNTYLGLIRFLFVYRKHLKNVSVYALSDSHFIFALFAVKLVRADTPVVLGVYHPRQFEVTLNKKWSHRREEVFRNIINNTTDKNIIFYTEACALGAQIFFNHIGREPNYISGPVELFNINKDISYEGNTFSIVTIGRYVDFKTSTITAMIVVVEELIKEGYSIRYDIYGHGPMEDQLIQRVNSSPAKEFINIKGRLNIADFEEVVSDHNLFWGMGNALLQGASIGIPAMIAIESEPLPITYGLVCDFNHAENPIIGDQIIALTKKPLKEEIIKIIKLSEYERLTLGEKCALAAREGYGPDHVFPKLINILSNADKPNRKIRINIIDILVIRCQTYFSRFSGKKNIQT